MAEHGSIDREESIDPFRVLIVEDDRSQAMFAEAILRGAGMQTEVVAVSEEMMPALERFDPDLVLMDLHMPGASGTELTARIRADARHAHLPVVFLTGDQDPERQLEALALGGDDYILKPVRPRHLVIAIESRARRARALQRERGTGSETERHPVTGLHTRPALMKAVAARLAAGGRGAALLIEMGNIAALRQRFGYAAFDELLSDAGRHLGTLVGADPAARLSDNAFLVLLADADGEAMESAARRLRDGIGYRDFQAGGENVRLRCTIGATRLDHGFEDAGAVLAAAEEASRAAGSAPHGIAVYTPPEALLASDISRELRASLAGEANGLYLAFQPVVAVAGNDTEQFQVLVRLAATGGGEHPAREFLPVAQSHGLLGDLDRWVMTQALTLLQRRRAERRPMRLFVSQSSRTLAQDGYATWLQQALQEASVEGPSLVVDLRLDDALVHPLSVQQFCQALVPSGVQFCLSQYRHALDAQHLLQTLPLGFLRLSADFARTELTSELRDEMRTIIQQAHGLGLQVIGQAVEDPQAAAALWMGGIDFIQGNLVQQPDAALDFDFQHAVL